MGVLLGAGATAVVLLLGFLLSLVPLWLAHHDATAAADKLQQANGALAAGQTQDAQAALASARADVDDAQGHLNGPAAHLWSNLPVLGPAVHDGRHLVSALDQATTAATMGVDLIDQATSPGAHVINGTKVNIPEIRRLAAKAHDIGPLLAAAQEQIGQVRGDEPLLGPKISSLQQRAGDQLATTKRSYRQLEPLLAALPAVLGAKGPQTYLLTIMNPAEMRYSGGATLQMATIRFDDGAITVGPSRSVAEVDHRQFFLNWRPVRGNIYHPPGPRRLASATYSPWWQVSGEELLRAWQAQTGERCQGLIAVDLQTLAQLFRITGPVDVPGYGELNAGNLVYTLAGNYDAFQNSAERQRINNALVPAFKEKFFNGEGFVQKGRALQLGAQGRHVALYFRDPRAEKAFAGAGFAGNLSTTRHDYLGVFSQNLNGSKADFWQSRYVTSQVTLHPDGSADERLSVIVGNPSPRYRESGPDPKTGYFTRWLGTLVSIFLPPHTQLGRVTADGKVLTHASLDQTSMRIHGVVNRPVLHHGWMLAPHQSGELTAEYFVPHASIVDRADGDLTYKVDLDPQDLVRPQSNLIRLTIPDGYRFGELPTGWSQTGPQTAVLSVPMLTVSSSWSVPILKN